MKYRYAYDESNNIIDVLTLEREGDPKSEVTKYHCISCNDLLIPRLGKIKQKHFAHKATIVCNAETYLHKLAKITLYNNYRNRLDKGNPFFLKFHRNKICYGCEKEINLTCNFGLFLENYDLTKHYKTIYLEQEVGGFIPDIHIKSENDEILLEISVTHDSDAAKIESKLKIIEIKIIDESDIDKLKTEAITLTDEMIKNFNFNFSDKILNYNKATCNKQFNVYQVYPSGKSIISAMGIRDFTNLKSIYKKIIKDAPYKQYSSIVDPIVNTTIYKKMFMLRKPCLA